jgi:hypothetical protein
MIKQKMARTALDIIPAAAAAGETAEKSGWPEETMQADEPS